MKTYAIIVSAFAILLSSCSHDEDILLDDNSLPKNGYLIRERPADNPWKPYVYEGPSKSRSQRMITISTKDCLGYSFKQDVAPIENMSNLGYKVIDIEKFAKAYPDKVRTWKILSQNASSFSFSNFDDFNSKSQMTKKVKTGDEVKLLFLSFGHKHTYTSLFGETLIANDKSVFGELDIIFRDSCYEMSYPTNLKNEIIKSFLAPSFVHDYHYMNPYDFIQSYGGVVASKFYTGGRATALYAGLHKETTESSVKERDMDKEISVSYSWSDKDSANAGLTFGRGNNAEISTTSKFTSVKMSVNTLGGNSSSTAFAIPEEVGRTSINLSSWLTSLDNPNNHVISEFADAGLIPITDFILEPNIRYRLNEYMGGDDSDTDFVQPQLQIIQTSSLYKNPFEGIIAIRTKCRNGVILGTISIDRQKIKLNDGLRQYLDWYNEIFNVGAFCFCEVQPTKRKAVYPPTADNTPYKNLLSHKTAYKKLEHFGILYFIDEVDKVGFSIPNNQQWINEYGLSKFISGLSPSKLTYQDLVESEYYIIGL